MSERRLISLIFSGKGKSPEKGDPGDPDDPGPQGDQGLNGAGYRGTYDPEATYRLNDVVLFEASTYICLVEGLVGWEPTTEHWTTVQFFGPKGDKGDKGDQGDPGGGSSRLYLAKTWVGTDIPANSGWTEIPGLAIGFSAPAGVLIVEVGLTIAVTDLSDIMLIANFNNPPSYNEYNVPSHVATQVSNDTIRVDTRMVFTDIAASDGGILRMYAFASAGGYTILGGPSNPGGGIPGAQSYLTVQSADAG